MSSSIKTNGVAAPQEGPSRPRGPVDAADVVESIAGADAIGIPSAGALMKAVLAPLMQPGPLTREAARLLGDHVAILAGRSALAPAPRDKRFSDASWSQNPGYRRLAQSYVSIADSLMRLLDDYEASGADWHDVEKARFAVRALVSTIAPTNSLVGNPAAVKRAFETGGLSLARGLRHLVHDVRHNGGMPAQTDRSAFRVGEHLAISPGAVIHRDAVAEVIEYAPSTDTVRSRPLVIIPPPIGRYYFLDLRPGRSLVEYAVSRGFHVFLISWRNPSSDEAAWDLDTYARRIVSTIDIAKHVSGSPDVNTLGFCAGGVLMTTVLSHLAQSGDGSVHSAGYAVTLLDFDEPAPIGAFSSPRLLELARRGSRRSGLITAQSLSAVFSWMRPDDLVFNYVVNQWLMGEAPPVFDILAWNADGTNLPARLHEQLLDIFRHNRLTRADELTVLGTPVDVARISVPAFVTGAVTDHLTPWTGCFRTTSMLSGPSTFALSNAGHVASLVNPPGNKKATYAVGPVAGSDPQAWRAQATERAGSWWEAWADWVQERSGDERPAPASYGGDTHRALEPAPGGYVLDRIPSA